MRRTPRVQDGTESAPAASGAGTGGESPSRGFYWHGSEMIGRAIRVEEGHAVADFLRRTRGLFAGRGEDDNPMVQLDRATQAVAHGFLGEPGVVLVPGTIGQRSAGLMRPLKTPVTLTQLVHRRTQVALTVPGFLSVPVAPQWILVPCHKLKQADRRTQLLLEARAALDGKGGAVLFASSMAELNLCQIDEALEHLCSDLARRTCVSESFLTPHSRVAAPSWVLVNLGDADGDRIRGTRSTDSEGSEDEPILRTEAAAAAGLVQSSVARGFESGSRRLPVRRSQIRLPGTAGSVDRAWGEPMAVPLLSYAQGPRLAGAPASLLNLGLGTRFDEGLATRIRRIQDSDVRFLHLLRVANEGDNDDGDDEDGDEAEDQEDGDEAEDED